VFAYEGRISTNCDSFSSFVESHGQPLLDLSLYVSSENYSSTTRPLYNTIQSFPLPYLTPNSIRAAAKRRTDHLGLSGLDLDTDGSRSQQSIIPESLRTSRTTVSSLLAASPEANARIRLDALARNFLEPLQDLRGEKKYLISNKQMSSLDCLALGYLSLMLVSELPQPWLSNTMRATFPGLCAWTEELKTTVFGPGVTVGDALLRAHGAVEETKLDEKSFLPWKAPQDRTVVGVGHTYLATLADSIPILGQFRRNERELQLSEKKAKDEQSPTLQALTITSGVLGSIGLLIGYMFHQGIISLRAEEPERQTSNGLDAFGEAGAALSIYATQMDAEGRRQRIFEAESNSPHTQPALEVEIGSDRTVIKETG
jgi:sorting and assembly machinery component 37